MKSTIKHILSSLLILLLLTSPTAYAAFIMTDVGEVFDIDHNSIDVDDAEYRLSPTVKVWTSENKKGNLSDVLKGDYVQISIIKFNKRLLVDTIEIMDGPLQDE